MRKLRAYGWRGLAGDAAGGLIAALIALPYGLAMATLMGLPPALGLFTSLLTTPLTAALGRNPVLIGGASTVTVPFMAAAVREWGPGGAAKVTLVAAVFMMVFSVLKLGRYMLKVPPAVVGGFSCGIGGMMVASQLKTIFGLQVPAESTAVLQVARAIEAAGGVQWAPAALAACVIAVAFAVAHKWPKMSAPLIGVLASMLLSRVFNLHEREIGRLPLEIPPFASFAWSARDIDTVLLNGFGLAFVASVNLLITSRVVEHFRGRRRVMKPSDADGELGAYGIANVCAGMFGAPMSVGIPARSLANVRCGGTTRVSNVIHGLVLLACLGLGAEFVSHIPLASLAGVTAYVGLCLLDWSAWRRLPRMRRADASAFLITAAGVLMVNAVAAVAMGCAVYAAQWAIGKYARPASAPELQPAE